MVSLRLFVCVWASVLITLIVPPAALAQAPIAKPETPGSEATKSGNANTSPAPGQTTASTVTTTEVDALVAALKGLVASGDADATTYRST
jgi:hypothetical protein